MVRVAGVLAIVARGRCAPSAGVAAPPAHGRPVVRIERARERRPVRRAAALRGLAIGGTCGSCCWAEPEPGRAHHRARQPAASSAPPGRRRSSRSAPARTSTSVGVAAPACRPSRGDLAHGRGDPRSARWSTSCLDPRGARLVTGRARPRADQPPTARSGRSASTATATARPTSSSSRRSRATTRASRRSRARSQTGQLHRRCGRRSRRHGVGAACARPSRMLADTGRWTADALLAAERGTARQGGRAAGRAGLPQPVPRGDVVARLPAIYRTLNAMPRRRPPTARCCPTGARDDPALVTFETGVPVGELPDGRVLGRVRARDRRRDR